MQPIVRVDVYFSGTKTSDRRPGYRMHGRLVRDGPEVIFWHEANDDQPPHYLSGASFGIEQVAVEYIITVHGAAWVCCQQKQATEALRVDPKRLLAVRPEWSDHRDRLFLRDTAWDRIPALDRRAIPFCPRIVRLGGPTPDWTPPPVCPLADARPTVQQGELF